MYKSPIDLMITEVANQISTDLDEAIFKSIINYVPNVDKGELIRALQYDRNQYEKGYFDGKEEATPKWIPAAKSLPAAWQPVLVYMKDQTMMISWINDELIWKIGYQSLITHWMPLPEPPKEDE